ncbi:MarR family transcriptional regulator [Nitratireductor sp. ZSWI3]|uniref:MarR family transcriptional regulator n=1 Tax=Nitratireductor sp. ZSWI3 TaxID=2966359 RepID=UPI00214FD02D|nr:MarR family transcriptional regulator [Nitratireductor sp. ZSWI3]MCR4266985.1 MarR family transcriptional regulator [Nitratireductor sp. ZSWI3]
MSPKLLYPFMDSEDLIKPRSGRETSREALNHSGHKQTGSNPLVSYFELARMMERASRRFSGLLRAELTRLGADDIGPAQAMVLLAIGDMELSVGDLLDRGHYVGSNISYYLKQLADGDYIDRVASQRDKRSARIRLTKKGSKLCADLRDAANAYERVLTQGDEDRRNLEIAFHTLHRLEVIWGNAARYGI